MKTLGKLLFFPLLLALATPLPTLAQSSERVIFASRNIYLGADVGVAMAKLPNFPAAAQFMWDQVRDTDFSQRAPLLAQELIATGAQVIGIQEATIWRCRAGVFSEEVVVYDFLAQLVRELNARGGKFSVAQVGDKEAVNPGFEIAPIPYLTMVRDAKTFQPLFSKDRVACGFTISDALLVRDDVEIIDVGTSEYSAKYSIIPTLMTIYRGYTWADLRIGMSTFRAITTHLESLWDSNEIPNAAEQATELIKDLQEAKMPVVVMGDFNSDPRDPRPSDAVSINPGAQPSASEKCVAQVNKPTSASAIDACNAYWKMVRAGFADISPDAFDPKNFTWGADALLAGPAPDRFKASIDMGGNGIFTDRLDYIFVKNGESAFNGALIGNQWPEGLDTWRCSSDAQIALSQSGANGLGKRLPTSREGRCLPSDHAGVAGAAELPANDGRDLALPERTRSPLTFWSVVGGLALLALLALLSRTWRALRRARVRRQGQNRRVE